MSNAEPTQQWTSAVRVLGGEPDLRELDPAKFYEGIETLGLKDELEGWHFDKKVFEEVVAKAKPRVIIEVGTWKGAGAIRMANLAPNARVYCVDIWRDEESIERQKSPLAPTLYKQFLHNMVRVGLEKRVVPVALTSSHAFRMLRNKKVTADLIYIDADHDFRSAYSDISMWWQLLNRGGVMFGDDANQAGVAGAVLRFISEEALPCRFAENQHWVIEKP